MGKLLSKKRDSQRNSGHSVPPGSRVIRFSTTTSTHSEKKALSGCEYVYWSCPDWITDELFRKLMFMVLQVYLQGDYSTIIRLVQEPLLATELIDQCNAFLASCCQNFTELEKELLENAQHVDVYIDTLDGRLNYVDLMIPNDPQLISIDPHYEVRKSSSVDDMGASQIVTKQQDNNTDLKEKCEMPSLPAPLKPSAPFEGSNASSLSDYGTSKDQANGSLIALDKHPMSNHESQSLAASIQHRKTWKENNHFTLTNDKIHTTTAADDKSASNQSKVLELIQAVAEIDNGQNSGSEELSSDGVRNDKDNVVQGTSEMIVKPPNNAQGKERANKDDEEKEENKNKNAEGKDEKSKNNAQEKDDEANIDDEEKGQKVNSDNEGKDEKTSKGAQGKDDKASQGAQGKDDKASKGAQGKDEKASQGAQGKDDKASKGAQGKDDKASQGAQGKDEKASQGAQGKDEKARAINESGTCITNGTNQSTSDSNIIHDNNIMSSHVNMAEETIPGSTKKNERPGEKSPISSPFLPIYGLSRNLSGNHNKESRSNQHQKESINSPSQDNIVIPFHGLSRCVFKRRFNNDGEDEPETFLNKRKRK